LLQQCAPRSIVLLLSGLVMLATIQLDSQFQFFTGKIENVGADRMLAAEFVPQQLAVAKVLPKFLFNIGGIQAESAGTVYDFAHGIPHLYFPSPYPLPMGEG